MKRSFFFFILAALLLSACGVAAKESSRVSPASGLPPEVVNDSAPAEKFQAQNEGGIVPGSPDSQRRIVIQNADLLLVVKDPQTKMAQIAKLAADQGGFVVSSSLRETYTQNGAKVPEASIAIRIPAASLDDTLNRLKADVIEVQSETRTGQDVTDQYVDLQSRLKARQAAEAQLLKMMEQSQNAQDTLAIFNQLTQIQSEIEVLKGQINYYDQASSMSAINITLVAEESIQPIQIAGWQPQGVARDAAQALVNFFQGFVNFIIWLAIFILPVAAILIALLALLWRLLRWFWRKVFPPKKTPPPAPENA